MIFIANNGGITTDEFNKQFMEWFLDILQFQLNQ